MSVEGEWLVIAIGERKDLCRGAAADPQGVSTRKDSRLRLFPIACVGMFTVALCAFHGAACASSVSAGDEVRGVMKTGDRIEGKVLSVSGTTYEIGQVSGGFLGATGHTSSVTVKHSELRSLERLGERRDYTIAGMAVGLIAGAGIGSSVVEDSVIPLGALVGAVLGGLALGAIGAALSTEDWVSIELTGGNLDGGFRAVGVVKLAR